jgi:hypothetical protein
MKLRSWLLMNALLLVTWLLANPPVVRADKLELKDGTQIEGIILKVEKGQVTVAIGQNQKEFSILDVTSMNFDTPHVPEGVSQPSLEHFVSNREAQELVRQIRDVDNAAVGLRQLLDQIEKEWGNGKVIASNETSSWDATKEQFSRALSRYQEVLGSFYSHVATKVDQYNRLAKESGGVRVGVRGAFNVGSALVSKEEQEPPLKKFVPSTWYDTIFYKGYSLGYTEGYYGARPRDFTSPQ